MISSYKEKTMNLINNRSHQPHLEIRKIAVKGGTPSPAKKA
jgi:hypothetical protein